MPNIVPTVYVVDDDPSVRASVARLLRSAGHVPETFASPAEFLEHCRTKQVQGCAVLDVHMPGLNGLEFIPSTDVIYSCICERSWTWKYAGFEPFAAPTLGRGFR